MDLQYLLLLQQLRNSAGSWLTWFMLLISDLASNGSGVLCVVIFWGFSREMGYWLISNCIGSLFFNNFFKLTACVYRPWIRCPELKPPARALESATGYSFPSGHTQLATSFYASCAVRKGKKDKKFLAFCVAMILLTAFSRNFLGVHTPQDVLTAVALSLFFVFLNGRLFDALRSNPSLLPRVLVCGWIAAVLCIIYFAVKPYPMDYIGGTPVVDPAVMKDDGYAVAGALLGILTGTFLEVRYVRFTTEGTIARKILRVIMGLPAAALIMVILRKIVYDLIGIRAGHVIVYAVLGLYIIYIYPALFTAAQKLCIEKSSSVKDSP